MTPKCGCSTCTSLAAPLTSVNRPGNDAIKVRSGTHETFFEAMKQQLSRPEHRAALEGLAARDSGDPSIAMFDAWATIADVLTFYDERIANEGYLRTAREPRSLTELGTLIGYQPRPGVASSVYLAYTVDDAPSGVVIPAATRAQSVPSGPTEQAQMFETSADLLARKEWNNMQVRLTRPQRISVGWNDEHRPTISESDPTVIYVDGTTTNLKTDDRLLFTSTQNNAAAWATIKTVTAQPALNRTQIKLADANGASDDPPHEVQSAGLFDTFAGLLKAAAKPASTQPSSAARLGLKASDAFASADDEPGPVANDAPLRLLSALHPDAAAAAFAALQNAKVTRDSDVQVSVLRRTTLFGANAPRVRAPQLPKDGAGNLALPAEIEWQLPYDFPSEESPEGGGESQPSVLAKSATFEMSGDLLSPTELEIDGVVDGVLPNSWVIIDTVSTLVTDPGQNFFQVNAVDVKTRAAFGAAGKVTRIQVKTPGTKDAAPWLHASDDEVGDEFEAIRRTVVWFPGAKLKLVEIPDSDSIPAPDPNSNATPAPRTIIPLNAVYSGFAAGRWVIVSGERADVQADGPLPVSTSNSDGGDDGEAAVQPEPVKATGVLQSELAMVLAVEHSFDPDLPGDRVRSSLVLAQELSYLFKRDTVKIYGNVVDATLGEKRSEVLGAGDATLANQTFTLRQPPLTYVPAPTTSGVQSTLDVTVSGVRYREVDALLDAGPRDRVYALTSDDAGKTTITFGDGVHGARLPSGLENIQANYRSGIGKAGNVKAGQITTPTDKPRGVREVVNPLAASGGADRARPADIRRNAPAAIRALDRLVSVQDYADFAVNFAGIGKASAVKLSNGLYDLVHVTIAGIDDAPILDSSDLFRDLRLALSRFGDPQLPIALGLRSAGFLVIDADVTVDDDHPWESVQPKLLTALQARFSFDALELGMPVHASQVLATIQAVEGVQCANLTTFTAIADTGDASALEGSHIQLGVTEPIVQLARAIRTDANKNSLRPPWAIAPASIAYLSAEIPETLTLQEKNS